MINDPHAPRVITQLRHGEHECASADDGTDFDYLFPDLACDPTAHLVISPATDRALRALGATMVEAPASPGNRPAPNSAIPPIYTYLGQFIDHDLTANTDRESTISTIETTPVVPAAPDEVARHLGNLRHPSLNLDSVYGDGPFAGTSEDDDEFVPYDGVRFRLGQVFHVSGVQIPPTGDLHRDLPRDASSRALIGDHRNDENLVIAQLHLAFLRFHNAAVDWIRTNEPWRALDSDVFLRARDLTRWAYQWVVVHDYLPTIAQRAVVDRVLASDEDLLRLARRTTYMPLEFSVAAFRFGHSMVRPNYDWNRNFGTPGNVQALASFVQMFEFTGKHTPPFRFGTPTLPSNWIAEWDRMVDFDAGHSTRFARPIDTKVVPDLATMKNEGNDPAKTAEVNAMLKQLAVRNLLRGYRLSIPTGQAVAEALGIEALSKEELDAGSSDETKRAMADGGFHDRTPLWFYVLKEAEVRAGGESLGEVGSTIVAATIIGQVRHDPTSYLHQSSWCPALGVRQPDGAPVATISDFLRFAGVLA